MFFGHCHRTCFRDSFCLASVLEMTTYLLIYIIKVVERNRLWWYRHVRNNNDDWVNVILLRSRESDKEVDPENMKWGCRQRYKLFALKTEW